MSLAIRGIGAKMKLEDTFHNDRHKWLKADYVIAYPSFIISDWGRGAGVFTQLLKWPKLKYSFLAFADTESILKNQKSHFLPTFGQTNG